MSKSRNFVVLGQPETQLPATCPKRCMVPLVCNQRFVQGYRCDRCGWAKLFPECHTEWAIPYCYERESQCEFQQHRCTAGPEAEQIQRGAVQ